MKHSHFAEMYRQESYYWWHVARRHIITSILKKNLAPGSIILDVGCGTGKLLEELSHHYVPFGIDINKSAISYAQKRNTHLNIKQADIQKPIPFQTKFDAIIALDVLEHIKKHATAIKNLHRLLKPEGLFIATVPALPLLYSYWDRALDHYRRYSKSQLSQLLTSTGFKLIHLSYFNMLLLFPLISFRLLKRFIIGQKAQEVSDFHELPPVFNHILRLLLEIEGKFALTIPLPIGLSLIVVAQKT